MCSTELLSDEVDLVQNMSRLCVTFRVAASHRRARVPSDDADRPLDRRVGPEAAVDQDPDHVVDLEAGPVERGCGARRDDKPHLGFTAASFAGSMATDD